ncbi:MAG: 50S ribosomal protein L3 N(5)-glutamine methyltransferase [Lautropia sp.]
MHTVRDLVRHAASRFGAAGIGYGHGTDNAYDEAVWLVCWTLHLPIEHYPDLADGTVAASESAAVLRLIAARCDRRQPLAYLTGEAWLLGYRFRSDARALVPRSPIAEVLVNGLLDGWLSPALQSAAEPGPTPVARILDLCTGGGSLAIIAADRFPGAAVTGADLSADALALAADNVGDYALGERVRLRHGDLFAALDAADRFDLIVCNPPYVNADSIARLPAEYRAEPGGALAGGADGMDLIARILAGAAAHLQPDGLLVLEIGHEQRHFTARFPTLAATTVATAGGPDRIVAITAAALIDWQPPR